MPEYLGVKQGFPNRAEVTWSVQSQPLNTKLEIIYAPLIQTDVLSILSHWNEHQTTTSFSIDFFLAKYNDPYLIGILDLAGTHLWKFETKPTFSTIKMSYKLVRIEPRVNLVSVMA